MKNFYINIKPQVFKILLIVLILSLQFFFTGTIHCDDGLIPINECGYNDGLIPINESNYNTTGSYNTSSWENNYQNRILQETYPQYRDGQPLYKPYNVGLQETPQGYRYELGGGSGTINPNATNYSMEGKPVALEYVGVDIHGNHIYSYAYPTTTCSTQLGEIQPVPTEVINERYYEGGVPRPPLNFSETTLGQRIYNKAKVIVKNRFAKYNEPTWQRRMRTEEYDRRTRDLKWARRAAEDQVMYERRKAAYEIQRRMESYKKVRRFD